MKQKNSNKLLFSVDEKWGWGTIPSKNGSHPSPQKWQREANAPGTQM